MPIERRPQPQFSVLIAAYNAAPYVAAALDSVLDQTCDDFEIILVDDGSTDETHTVVTRWVADHQVALDGRFTLRHGPNGGQSAALERGFGVCRGRYIALLDADDRWRCEKLARTRMALLAEPWAGLVVHPLAFIRPDGTPTGGIRPKAARLSRGDVAAEVRRTGRHVVGGSTAMVIRRDLFQSLTPFPTTRFAFAADAYLALGACLAAPVAAIDEPLGEYRIHSGGQYLRRMVSREGLAAQLEFQTALARHFGIEATIPRNSNWNRNVFAHARLGGGGGLTSPELGRLLRATLSDPMFPPIHRVALAGFWLTCAAAPQKRFEQLWKWFQYRQTGHDKIGESASA